MLDALDAYLDALQHARDLVAAGDRDGARSSLLERARAARRNLPVGHLGQRPTSSSCASRCPTGRASSPRSRRSRGRLGVERRRLRDRALDRGWSRCARDGRRRRRADAFEAGLHALGYHTQPDGPAVSASVLPTSSSFGGGAPAARPAPGARRQVDLAPRAAVRRDRRRPQHDHEPRDRRRRRARRTRRSSSSASTVAHGTTRHRRARRRLRRAARARRRARLRQLGHDDADPLGTARRAAVPLGAHRRRVAAARGRWRASSSRSARWARRSTAATTATRAPLTIRGGDLAGMRHELAVASGAGEDRARARRAAGRRRRPRSCRRRPSRDHTERMLARARRTDHGRRPDGARPSRGAPSTRSTSTSRAIRRRPRSSSSPRRSRRLGDRGRGRRR